MNSIVDTNQYHSDQNFCRTENAQWDTIKICKILFPGVDMHYTYFDTFQGMACGLCTDKEYGVM